MYEKQPLDPKTLRKHILTMAYCGQTAHVACAFSIVEILAVLLGEVMNFDPSDPERDYLVLSKGHGVMALYACMRELGLLTQEQLENYFKDGSGLHGLAEATMPGVDASTGSLGHGLPVAVGIAYGLKLRGKPQKTYCIVGDGELNEGSCWEALLFAAHHHLDNFTLIVDMNGHQAMGKTKDILNMHGIHKSLTAIGISSRYCAGHNRAALKELLTFPRLFGPSAIIADTTKGHGISFMESDNSWHYKRLDQETYESAMAELA